MVKSLYSTLSIFLNGFFYFILRYHRVQKHLFKRGIIPFVTTTKKKGGRGDFKYTNQYFQYFNIDKYADLGLLNLG